MTYFQSDLRNVNNIQANSDGAFDFGRHAQSHSIFSRYPSELNNGHSHNTFYFHLRNQGALCKGENGMKLTESNEWLSTGFLLIHC